MRRRSWIGACYKRSRRKEDGEVPKMSGRFSTVNDFLKSLSVAVGLVFFAFADGAAERINFSFSSLSGNNAVLWVAKDAGFFKKHGIDAQLVYIVGGRVVVQAMLAGEVHMGIAGPGAVIRSNLAGGDLVYVGFGSTKMDFALVTPKGITDIPQLRGKRVGIGQFGGAPDYTTRMVLEKHALIPDKDVRIIQMFIGQPGRLAALQSGAVDGIVINPPLTLQAKQMGFNVYDYARDIPYFLSMGFVTTRRYARQSPHTVEKVVKALLDGSRYVFSNEEGVVKILSRYTKVTDYALLRSYYREVLSEKLDRSLYPDAKGLEVVLEQERKTNPAAAKARPEDFVDTTFLDKLKKEGY
jgi:NitT/TauT family transport system substrate-binding protein